MACRGREEGRVNIRVPLLVAKECPVCQQVGVYNMSDAKGPPGWIHLMAFGVNEWVCSDDCVAQIYRHQTALQKQLDESRKEPLFPPDVVI